MGFYNSNANPRAVTEEICYNSVADGWAPIASHKLELNLAPGEEHSLVFLLGYVENPEDKKWASADSCGSKKFWRSNNASGIINKEKAYALQEKYSDKEKVMAAFEELCSFWNKTLGNFAIKTDDEKLNRMALWNQYQCVVTYNFARSASYFESGIGRGIGFRDTSQDMLGVAHSLPNEKIRERLFDVASTQFPDGSAYHQFQPLTKRGNSEIGSNFNDDPLWLIFGIGNYIRETGDINFLNEMVPFDNNENDKATMFEHLRRAYHYIIEHKGPHNLPLIGRADWNDCLNLNCFSKEPNDSFQTCTNKDGTRAESVMIAQMFVFVTPDYSAICRILGLDDEAIFADEQAKLMEQEICKSGWDGQWYLRAYDDFGNKVGSEECKDGKIFIETQGFGSMAKIGEEKKMPEKALDSLLTKVSALNHVCLHT